MSEQSARSLDSAKIKKLVLAALFSALAYAAAIFTAWIKVGFLTFDIKDTVVTLAGLILGPVYAVIISFLVSLIEIITIPDTGFWGFLMNFISTAAFSFVCSLIYKYKKNIVGASIGLVASIFSMTAVMMLFNLFITPLYTGNSIAMVAEMIPTTLFPFNFTKAVMNAALVLMTYKPISRVLKVTKMTAVTDHPKSSDAPPSLGRKILLNVGIYGTGIALVVASLLVFFLVLDGKFGYFGQALGEDARLVDIFEIMKYNTI